MNARTRRRVAAAFGGQGADRLVALTAAVGVRVDFGGAHRETADVLPGRCSTWAAVTDATVGAAR